MKKNIKIDIVSVIDLINSINIQLKDGSNISLQVLGFDHCNELATFNVVIHPEAISTFVKTMQNNGYEIISIDNLGKYDVVTLEKVLQ
ncbi:MAG TPA: hypothetical protein PK771_04620 [Spirochaetota bacterium]|mgnify:CR=1 FL=1|nr:hypothetical protein [Spirochaetota bacterium]